MQTRRNFLKTSALAAGAFMIVPRHVLGRGYTPPSDRLNIAGIGAGGKGESDINFSWDNDKNNIVALCDVDWNQAKKSFERFPKANKYRNFREMLEKEKDIDAVTISTPDHTHAAIAMAAMQLGKHVYVQKPLTHNIAEARQLTETARKQQVVTQMGNQGSSGPGLKAMTQWFEKGLIGKVHTVQIWTDRPVWPSGIKPPTDKPTIPADMDWENWIGPASMVDFHPAYHPFKWRGWWNFGTGALGDIGCHLMDAPFRILGLGYPTEVEASVGSIFVKDWTPEWIPESCPPSSNIQLKFAATSKNNSPVTMTWSDGGIRPFRPAIIPADDFLGEPSGGSGVMMIGKKGVIVASILGRFATLYRNNGEKITIPAADSEWPSNEYGHQASWASACKAGFNSPEHKALTSSFDFSGPLTESVLMGNLAIRSYNLRNARNEGGFDYPGRKKLLWDGVNMKITNFEDANQFVKRENRKGWTF
jgi:predicted dehydrogenase